MVKRNPNRAQLLRDIAGMAGTYSRQIMITFGRRLKRARERAGYRSAQQFAHVLGKAPHAYRKYERGESPPDLPTMVRICELLGVTPNDLLPASRSSQSCPVERLTAKAS